VRQQVPRHAPDIALLADERLHDLFHQGAQEVDVTLLEELAAFVDYVHLELDHRALPSTCWQDLTWMILVVVCLHAGRRRPYL